MPQYFFHVRGPNFYTDDADGVTLPDEGAARKYAKRIADDLKAEAEYSGHTVIWPPSAGMKYCASPCSATRARGIRSLDGDALAVASHRTIQ